MHFIESTKKWIDSVKKTINTNRLDPTDSLFMIGFFCSMDTEFVEYFKNKRVQISEYSGKHLHIFSPLVLEGDTVNDDTWDSIRNEFRVMGIPVTNEPAFVFFRLEGNSTDELEPRFIAAFELRSFAEFDAKLRKAIYIFRNEVTKDTPTLKAALLGIFRSKDLITSENAGGEFLDVVKQRLPKRSVFVSHSFSDQGFAMRLVDELSNDDALNFWIAEKEIALGSSIHNSVTEALKKCSFLLLIVSKESAHSKFVNFELSQFMAHAGKGRIIPIIIEKTNGFGEPIQGFLNDTKYLDFTDLGLWAENIRELKGFLDSENKE